MPVADDARVESSESAEVSASEFLVRAKLANSSAARAKYATAGLALAGIAGETQGLLLRQLYLAHMETERFREALVVARDMIAVRVLPDVARQDAARACMGLGKYEEALDHLRIAGRTAPASRRAIHAWTVGCLLYLLGRYEEAIGAFTRASRWGPDSRALFHAQRALARWNAGESGVALVRYRRQLEASPGSQGYGQFVLAELCDALGDHEGALAHLRRFIKRSESGRRAMAVALSLELERARGLERRLNASTN